MEIVANEIIESVENDIDQQPISRLLQGTRCMYRVYHISDKPEDLLDCRAHKPVIPYDKRCEPFLRNLGLYQVSMIEHCKIDHRLITVFVERWRPETHTFNLSIGEFTVTLQDVSCLWGLPIAGNPVVGPSDDGLMELVESSLGADMRDALLIQKKNTQSGFRISLHLLRVHFPRLNDGATDEEIARYTRAYVLDLFGSILFPDVSGDSVPIMYLKFLQNLSTPQNINWGAAVLACLYRNLSTACMVGKKLISGPLLLLQHWCWTWFNVARPSFKTPRMPFGGPNEELRPPFAIKWRYYKIHESAPARSSLTYYRYLLENILISHVNWQPYKEFFPLAPRRVSIDSSFFLARVPCICFWIVAWHYPERVMRQFGLYQTIPPRDPHSWEELRSLDKIGHGSRTTTDWSKKHATYVNMWEWPMIINETRPYDESTYRDYRRWYQQEGLYTVFIRGQIEHGLDRPLPPPRDSDEVLGYVSGGFRLKRMGTRSLQRVEYIIQNLYKRGTRSLAKVLLKSHRDDAMDADTLHEFERVLREAGLPTNVDELVDSNDETSDEPHSSPRSKSLRKRKKKKEIV